MNTEETEYKPGDTFFAILKEVSEGELLTQLDEVAKELVAAVMTTGNAGKMALSLAVKRKGGARQCQVVPKLAVNIPRMELPSRILFADTEGMVYSCDPLQTQMNFNPDAPIRLIPSKQNAQVVDVVGMPTKMPTVVNQ